MERQDVGQGTALFLDECSAAYVAPRELVDQTRSTASAST